MWNFFGRQYLGETNSNVRLPRAFAFQADDHRGLPPVFIATTKCDPTRDDAERYGDKLASASVEVRRRHYAGMPYDFVSWLGILPAAQQAIDDACEFPSHYWRIK